MPTLSGTPPLSAEQMADIKDHALAMELVLTGVFDSRIAELKQVQADITTKQEALIVLDQANTVRADADTYAASVKTQANTLFDQANKAASDASIRAAQVASQQKVIDAGMADLKALQGEFATSQQESQNALQADHDRVTASLKAANDALAQREAALEIAVTQLQADQAQLAKDQAAVADLKSQLTAKLDAFAKL